MSYNHEVSPHGEENPLPLLLYSAPEFMTPPPPEPERIPEPGIRSPVFAHLVLNRPIARSPPRCATTRLGLGLPCGPVPTTTTYANVAQA